jgi:hypothetical protein
VLCKQNPARRCTGNFAPKYWVGDRLLAKCDGEIQVSRAHGSTALGRSSSSCVRQEPLWHLADPPVGRQVCPVVQRLFWCGDVTDTPHMRTAQIELLDAATGQRITDEVSNLRLEVSCVLCSLMPSSTPNHHPRLNARMRTIFTAGRCTWS